jgi:hypothetical protein
VSGAYKTPIRIEDKHYTVVDLKNYFLWKYCLIKPPYMENESNNQINSRWMDGVRFLAVGEGIYRQE